MTIFFLFSYVREQCSSFGKAAYKVSYDTASFPAPFPQRNVLNTFVFRHVAFGHCFRKEAGGAGSATRGLYRVHQFSKVELFGLTASETGEESEQLLQDMVNFQVEVLEDLGLCYR